MERKRKLPARAAARVEHVSKKRNSTPPDVSATSTPSSAITSPQPAEPIAQEQPPPPTSAPLPKSLQPGHPLPTVEKPQPDDLSTKEFQSIQESGVMAESLSRSRQKWINDGVFEKYWTKPTKRKGIVKEDSNNPAKDTMTKIGQVTITIEPHVLEATMYAVKDPKPAPTSTSSFRPIMQYGPPNGAMPPPPKPTTTPAAATASPSPATLASPSKARTPVQAAQPAQSVRPSVQPAAPPKDDSRPATQQYPPASAAPPSAPPSSQQTDLQRPQLPASIDNPSSVVSPRGLDSVLAAPQPAHTPVPGTAHSRPPQPPLSQPTAPSSHPLHVPAVPPTSLGAGTSLPAGAASVSKTTAAAPKPVQPPASGADPIIVTLAERASEDPHLRDLMKRVAVGEAAAHELAHFQRIIDQITFDYKKKGLQQDRSAERLIVNNRTVKYYADEVRAIVDIILASNPKQRSSDLRPPPGIDPLIMLLLKETLDKPNTKSLIDRITDGKPRYTDGVEMKTLLERLQSLIKQDAKVHEAAATANAQTTPQSTPTQAKGEDATKKLPASTLTQSQSTPASQQALRSKGPPPSTKFDITAVVLEFAGGTGDRYLFPKYSILEFSTDGTQVIVSFLIVRRGSKLEYGGDRALDYYQPVTLRLHSHSPKVLEHLARVVAPPDEVQRYMDDVMENMTRAEYVLLAMRLPRAEREDPTDERSDTPKASESSQSSHLPGVLWDSRSASAKPASVKLASAKSFSEDEQYQNFIATVT
ncbi:hypothetical protein F5Y09DRAFT_155584 [Xylaria sp. FL1042]|nr:hypothetical protein F5Y09DRAFT_155584 [Xylaria sp. FL1042]